MTAKTKKILEQLLEDSNQYPSTYSCLSLRSHVTGGRIESIKLYPPDIRDFVAEIISLDDTANKLFV